MYHRQSQLAAVMQWNGRTLASGAAFDRSADSTHECHACLSITAVKYAESRPRARNGELPAARIDQHRHGGETDRGIDVDRDPIVAFDPAIYG